MPSTNEALDAAMIILCASEQVQEGIALHIEETPHLGNESKEILTESGLVIQILARIIAQQIEHSVTQNDMIEEHLTTLKKYLET